MLPCLQLISFRDMTPWHFMLLAQCIDAHLSFPPATAISICLTAAASPHSTMFITAPLIPTLSMAIPLHSITACCNDNTADWKWKKTVQTVTFCPPAASKDNVVGTGARTVLCMPGCIGAGGDVRIWAKTWRKALVDENKDLEDINDSTNDDDGADRPLNVGVA